MLSIKKCGKIICKAKLIWLNCKTVVRDILDNALKSNVYLEKGVLTGIYRIAKAGIFSGLNNVIEYNLLDSEFTEHYGFTQAEVDNLLSKVPNLTNQDAIKDWYNDYTHGEQTVYNPWSIMCCLVSRGKLGSYLLQSTSYHNLMGGLLVSLR